MTSRPRSARGRGQYWRKRPAASKGEVQNLQQQVEHQKSEIKTLKTKIGTPRIDGAVRDRRRRRRQRRNNRPEYSGLESISNMFNPYGSNNNFSTINRKRKDYNILWNDYLNAIMDPLIKDPIIPDLLMFPFTTVQSKTVCTVVSATNGASNDGTFCLAGLPNIGMGFYCLDGTDSAPSTSATFTIDGTVYGQGQIAGYIAPHTIYSQIFDSATDATTAYGWRPVSMGIYIKYIGPPLTASGRISVGCIPAPYDEDGLFLMTTFERMSTYNYATEYQAVEGCTQVWFPAGPCNRQVTSFFQDTDMLNCWPVIVVAADGLPATTKCIEITAVCNYEIFSTAQVFTAAKTRLSNSVKMDHAASTTSAVFQRNGGNHRGSTPSSHTPWWKTALSIGKDVAEIALPIMTALI